MAIGMRVWPESDVFVQIEGAAKGKSSSLLVLFTRSNRPLPVCPWPGRERRRISVQFAEMILHDGALFRGNDRFHGMSLRFLNLILLLILISS